MAKKLKTRNVFLDTEVFRSRNFSFNGETMSKVVDLASKESIHIYLTDVTVDQIKTEIRKFVDARPVVTYLKNESGPFWSREELITAFKRAGSGDMGAEILEGFEAFCKEARVEIIPTNDRSIETSALSALELQCTQQRISAYVISADNGFRERCEGHDQLFYLEKLEEFVDLVEREHAFAGLANEAFAAVRDQIAERVKEESKRTGFHLADVSGDVDAVRVTDIKLSEEYLIDVDEKQANFHLFADIKLTAEVTYEKPGTGIEDSELGGLIFVDMTHETVEDQFDGVKVSVTLALESADLKRSRIKELLLNRGEDFAIYILPSHVDLK